jgi:23S rRNA (pseudouridine1915-N3)-methyltransferase
MRLAVVAVGQRVPDWKTLEAIHAAERQRIEAAIPKGAHVVALDERGTSLTTVALAQRLKEWQLQGRDVALVIGGPDGLAPEFKRTAHERIRLSDLTLPHAMVRVLLVEQLYRAWSINANHPYHRE